MVSGPVTTDHEAPAEGGCSDTYGVLVAAPVGVGHDEVPRAALVPVRATGDDHRLGAVASAGPRTVPDPPPWNRG